MGKHVQIFWEVGRGRMHRLWVFCTKAVSHRTPLLVRVLQWARLKLFTLHHWLFPERQIILRSNGRVRFVSLSHGVQFVILIVVSTLVGWGGYSTHAFFAKDRILAEKNERIAEALFAYRDLLNQYADSQQRFASAAANLEANHSYLLGIVAPQDSAKTEDKRTLADSGEETHKVGLEGILKANKQLKIWMAEIQISQHDVVRVLTSRVRKSLGKTKTLIAGLGPNVERVLSEEVTAKLGQGGPFLALRTDRTPEDAFRTDLARLDMDIDRWDGVQQLLRTLPLVTPSDAFYMASSYGRRKDPFNRRAAVHYGVDLAGVRKSPILSTASGVVVFAARNGKYGKMIEIDHGRGIHTRYGHLHRINVKVGQRVGFRERIGLMGSTGRSTGPHVHYEIRVNGTPYNPAKFFKVGKHVFKNWEG
ncbi:MAG: hypothetical protein COA65_05305 [Rhodospirillaceae bacterium]|nr:MAG: hypothetical protein COA65_05305 [Rhodospirillaceae bacterium]